MNSEFYKLSNNRAVFGEGPLYDHRTNVLHWIDIEGKKIFSKQLKNEKEESVESPDLISSIQLTEKTDELVGTIRHGFYRINLSKGNFELIAEVERDVPTNRFNDGKCDSLGRCWAGTMNLDLVSPTGSLYCLNLDKTVKQKAQGLAISNGLAWSLEEKAMFLIDTPVKKIYRFDFELSSGEISNRNVCIDFQNEEGRPDGMTIDSEGMLWIAHARGGRVSRWDASNARKLSEFTLPVKAVTSLTFGNKDLDTLYVTTAYAPFKEEEAGFVYAFEPGVKGVESEICIVGSSQ